MKNNKYTQGFLRLSQVLELIPVSKSTWWLGVKNGHYPKPIKLSEKTTAWRVEDIQELIAKLATKNQDG
jgi:predicted DNA-binding transcriptional regulator AlpA